MSPPLPSISTPIAAHQQAASTRPRSVRVADSDHLSKRVEYLAAREAELDGAVFAVQESLSVARQELHGFDILRVVARQEEFALGLFLQPVQAMRLVDSVE